MSSIDGKVENLRAAVRSAGSMAVAFSGGVDSTLLLKVAAEELGERALAITIDTPFHSRHEVADARRLAAEMKVRHLVLEVDPLRDGQLSSNPPDRCYLCKRAVFTLCLELARNNDCSVLSDGSNVDDLKEHRPGRRALQELGVASPLMEAGFTKPEVREYSRLLGLSTWDKPPLACLLTRFPHGEEITPERLRMVERCEDFLREKGFGLFRVRAHGELARIEAIGEELLRLVQPGVREEVARFFHAIGFNHVSVDLDGYRCGSMDPAGAG